MKKILKRGMSGLLAVLMAFTVLAGFGTGTLRQKLYEWLGNRLQQLHYPALYGFL